MTPAEGDYGDEDVPGPLLTSLQKKALIYSAECMPEDLRTDHYNCEIEDGLVSDHVAIFNAYLPPKHAHRYTVEFFAELRRTAIELGPRLLKYIEWFESRPDYCPPPLARTTAEELILDAIVKEADRRIADERWHFE